MPGAPRKVIPVIHKPPLPKPIDVKPWYHPWESAPADPKGLTLKMILQAVANHFETTPEYLLKRTRRDRRINKARQVAFHLARQLTDKSLLVTAREFNRDHTTILYGDRKMLPITHTDPDIVAIRQTIEKDMWKAGGSFRADPNQLALEV